MTLPSRKLFLLFVVALSTLAAHARQATQICVSTNHTEMVFSVLSNRVMYSYYGKKLSNPTPFLDHNYRERLDNGVHHTPQLYPAYGGYISTNPALKLTHTDGVQTTELVYVSHATQQLDANRTLTTVRLKDPLYPIDVELNFTAYRQEDVITQSVTIDNRERKQIAVENIAAAYLPLHADAYYLTHFHGLWAAEMRLAEEKLTAGIKNIESKRGLQTTTTANPAFMLSLNSPLQEDAGEVYAGALAWSGNYKISFEQDEGSRLHIVAGTNDFASTYYLKQGGKLTTPTMVWTYSPEGSGRASRNLHDWVRTYNMAHGNMERPTVLNSWEGAYFDFNEQTITDMIDDAAEIGIEMFVLDDGWFGNKYPRNSDNAGLGDWQTNTAKLPHGIDYLARHAVSKGLKFGIWIEPEMVNPKSELAERHPEWIVKSGKRDQIEIRQQLILDLSNPAVQDFVVKTFDDVLALSKDISYIKWDANRFVTNFGSDYLPADKQSHFWIEYTKGLYAVYERIRAKHPDIIIQLCSSGGSRVDMGAMKYHDEFWTSDNTNSLDRVFIQYSTNLFYPAMATAAHVSTSPNHQTGTVAPLKFRFDVAMSGRLGMELQPKNLSKDERAFARQAISTYKRIRPIVQLGDLYRLKNPYNGEGWASQMYVSKNQSQAVFFAYSLSYHANTSFFHTKLKGLSPTKNYRITELNVTHGSSVRGDTQVYSGDFLMNAGLGLTINNAMESTVLLLTEE